MKKYQNKQALSFNLTFRQKDDALSLQNCEFCDFINRIYPIELEINDITDTDRPASYLDLHLEIDKEGMIRAEFNDKIDYFNFPIAYFPFTYSNISAAPAYGVYISQVVLYSRACCSHHDLLDGDLLLTRKLLHQ